MLLILDDERDFNTITSVYYRRLAKVEPYTENQKTILQKYAKKHFLVQDYNQAVSYIDKYGIPDMIMFDHDLGYGKDGYDFLKYVCNFRKFFEASFHSMNFVARFNMINFYNNFVKSLD